ncbi:MAG: NAD-dependent dehydratase [Bdellovibrionaceae bacterium]|nr:NAD-dependent dehydratase [Pseudobdellovibrionaceae bacterium]|tara:strand:+ start:5126 stop:6109 length:984 start_codon:yes stop_codon:yes gene_type:complete
MKHVLVTGGAGFIGSYLCESLLDQGYVVTAVDNLVTGRRSNLDSVIDHPNFDYVEADITEFQDWESLRWIRMHGLFGVLHFACPASPIDFDKIPFEILKVDSEGTFRTVDLALKYGARYVVASTSEIYGDPLEHPQKESYFGNVNTLGPRACYDETKRFSEALVSTAIRGVGMWNGKSYSPLNGGMVRIFNTYGPRMRPDDGRVVPELCIQALKGSDLTIHGDGSQTRSFCFVTDLVKGILAYFHSDLKIPVNLGNPVENTIKEFAQTVIEITQSSSSLKLTEARIDDPKKRRPDISRAKEYLKWEPEVSLREGLIKTIEDFKKATV